MSSSSSSNVPQEDLFDPEFLDRLRAMFLRLRKRRQMKKKGIQPTPSTGFTREFKGYRHYVPQDDYRSIDWQLYARLERLFIRLYEEVQEYHLHVVIDASSSMASPFPEKRNNVLKLGVALSYLALISNHRVSLYAMRDRVVTEMAPLKGQGNIQRVLEYLSRLEFDGTTHLRRCFESFRPSRQRYGVIFVLSDLFGQNINAAGEALRHAASWPGESHVIQIFHPWEEKPNLEGEIQLVDVETSEARKMWVTKREVERYEEAFAAYLRSVERECASRQIDYMRWRTDGGFEDLFLELLGRGSVLAGGA